MTALTGTGASARTRVTILIVTTSPGLSVPIKNLMSLPLTVKVPFVVVALTKTK